MGNAKSHTVPPEQMNYIMDKTGFNEHQVQKLYQRFQALDRTQTARLTREDFMFIPELAINPLADRIVDMFVKQHREHSGDATSEEVDFIAFCLTLNNFNIKQTSKKKDSTDAECQVSDKEDSKEKKLKFLFQMYDQNGDGSVTKDELLTLLKLMVGTNISDKQLDLIATRTVGETDLDDDRCLDFEEFKEGLKRVDIGQKMTVRFT